MEFAAQQPVSAHDAGFTDTEANPTKIGFGLQINDDSGQTYKRYILEVYRLNLSANYGFSWRCGVISLERAIAALLAVDPSFKVLATHMQQNNDKTFSVGTVVMSMGQVGVFLLRRDRDYIFVQATIDPAATASFELVNKLLRELYPPPTNVTTTPRITIDFWMQGSRGGGESMARTLDVVPWSAVQPNYTDKVQDALGKMMNFKPADIGAGQLFLWYGPPGTGKTYALRALAWEWRYWCDIFYITDPATLLGAAPQYLNDVLLNDNDNDLMSSWYSGEPEGAPILVGEQRWKLLVLEDSGELLSLTARQEAGQGLSRLLNMVDGLLGQGLKFLTLITTNEQLKKLHPAVARPGRCAARVEFSPLNKLEASEFLKRHNRVGEIPTNATLAELYAAAHEQIVVEAPGERMGFK